MLKQNYPKLDINFFKEPMMPLIVWTESLSVGIDSIDEQHKVLIQIINDLNNAKNNNETDAIMQQIFTRLIEYTEQHFKYEEDIFDEYAYEDTEAHKKQHQALIETIYELKQKFESGETRIGIEVLQFLNRWLTDHILKTDHAYTDFMHSNQIK